MLRWGGVLVAAGVLCCAPAATAATVSTSYGTLVYTAGSGVANGLTITRVGDKAVFHDAAENITVGPSAVCTGAGTKTVSCNDTVGLLVLAGDLDDHVSVSRAPGVPTVAVTFIEGGPGADVLTGGPQADVFLMGDGDGADTITGGEGGGHDVADYEFGSAGVTVHLGAPGGGNGVAGENDVFTDGSIVDAVGTPFADVITGGDEVNRITPLGGADDVRSAGGADQVDASAAAFDVLAGGGLLHALPDPGRDEAADTVDAGPGDDTVTVGGGDTVHAGDGADTVSAAAHTTGAETVFGEGGDDVVVAGAGDDVVDGGDGADTIVGEATAPAGVSDRDTFAGGPGDDVLRGLVGDDALDGGAGSDDLEGADGADTLTGGTGIDTIAAGTGPDTVRAADGERDDVSCGGGTDSADGDLADAVAADCETVSGGAIPLAGATPGAGGGTPGPAGAAAPPPAFVLVAVDRRFRVPRGRRVSLRYVSTLAGAATLVVRKGSRTIATVTGRAKADVNRIAWNGRQGRRAAARGTYRLTLTLVALDGRTARATAVVTVR